MTRRPHTARELRRGGTTRAAVAPVPMNSVARATLPQQRPWGAGFQQQQPKRVDVALRSPAHADARKSITAGAVRMQSRRITRSRLAVAMERPKAIGDVRIDIEYASTSVSPRRKGVAPLPFVPRTCPPMIRSDEGRVGGWLAGCDAQRLVR